METLSLIIGYIGTAVNVASYQIKRRNILILFQMVGNILPSISFLLLGPDKMIGGLVTAVAVAHTATAYFAVKKGKLISKPVSGLFIVLYAAASILPGVWLQSFAFPADLCPLLCGIFFVLALQAPTQQRARIFYLISAAPWLVYDIYNGAMANLATHTISFLSVVISIIRYDLIPYFTARKEQS